MPVKSAELKKIGLPSSETPAFGLALSPLGKAKVKINLASKDAGMEQRPVYFDNRLLAGVIFFMVILLGASYLIKDKTALGRFESALSEVKVKKNEVARLVDKRDLLAREDKNT